MESIKNVEITKDEAIRKINPKYKNLINFINRYKSPYCAEITKEGQVGLIVDTLEILNRAYMITLDINKQDTLSLVDDLTDYQRLYDMEYDIDIQAYAGKYEQLKKDIQETGFKLQNCGSGNDDYMWHELIIQTKDFTEEKLKKATEFWDKYNKDLDNIRNNKEKCEN